MKENKKTNSKQIKGRRTLICALSTIICAISMLIMQNIDDLAALTFGYAAVILIVATIISAVDYAHNLQVG